jgi:hypothetical protein
VTCTADHHGVSSGLLWLACKHRTLNRRYAGQHPTCRCTQILEWWRGTGAGAQCGCVHPEQNPCLGAVTHFWLVALTGMRSFVDQLPYCLLQEWLCTHRATCVFKKLPGMRDTPVKMQTPGVLVLKCMLQRHADQAPGNGAGRSIWHPEPRCCYLPTKMVHFQRQTSRLLPKGGDSTAAGQT